MISKINDNIYLGSYEPSYNNTQEFKNLNIDVIINCAEEITYPHNKYIIKNYPIIDGDCISFLENIDNASLIINNYVLKNKKIYIHCMMGVSRSPAILIYYFMFYQNYKYDDAFDLINNIRNISIDPIFEDQLRMIEE